MERGDLQGLASSRLEEVCVDPDEGKPHCSYRKASSRGAFGHDPF